mmetsp:Transcript_26170/g.55406  ORF Transcript_26170/g.55406 Transcript_26170/m.55406 type:complete len:477 (+) Transcript_26170:98-1528(+)
MSGTIWEVVGGAANGGVIARVAKELTSPELGRRLTVGSLVMEVERVGDRLCYNRIHGTGYGPDSGWVTIRRGTTDLLVQQDLQPPKGGWKVVGQPLPEWTPPPDKALGLGWCPSGNSNAPIEPASEQTQGEPYVYYKQIGFNESKPGGLRMSGCLATMDDARTECFVECDMSVSSFRNVTCPFTQVAIEMMPAVQKLGRAHQTDGLLYHSPKNKGAITSWVRSESLFGWPGCPIKSEETSMYLVGKQKESSKKERICTGRFIEAFVDDATGSALQGQAWESEFDRFYAKVKTHYSSGRLTERNLAKMYQPRGQPFTPGKFTRVKWLMSTAYGDLWGLLYHGRTPELLWDLNKAAGESFAKLVELDDDPQAITMQLPKKMQVGTLYEALIFLEEETQRAVYILRPDGSTSNSDTVLAVTALYDWAGTPQDGKSLRAEDSEVIAAGSRAQICAWAAGGPAKATKTVDLSLLPAQPKVE